MNMWIQLHDLSSQDRDSVSEDEAKQTLLTFDWQSELRKRDEVQGESCDPGLGLVAQDGAILHICPQDSTSCYVYYHYSKPKKLLGFIPIQSNQTHYIESCSLTTAAELIGHHFLGNTEAILKTR